MSVTQETIQYDASKAIAELGKLAKSLEQIEVNTKDAADGIKRLEGSADGLGDKASKSSKAMQSLSGATGDLKGVLRDVNPTMYQFVDTTGDLAGVMKGAGGAIGASTASLGAIGVVIALTTAGFMYFSNAVEKAEAKVLAMQAANDKMMASTKALDNAVDKANVTYAVTAGILDPAELDKINATQQAAATFATQRALAEDQLKAAVQGRVEAEKKGKEAIEAADRQITTLKTNLGQLKEKEAAYAGTLILTSQEERNAVKSKEALAKANAALAEQQKYWEDEFKAAVKAENMYKELQEIIAGADMAMGFKDIRTQGKETWGVLEEQAKQFGISLDIPLSQVEQLKMLLVDIALTTMPQDTADRLTEEIKKRIANLDSETNISRMTAGLGASGVNSALSTLGSAASGDILALGGLFGPVGEGVASLLSMFETLGATGQKAFTQSIFGGTDDEGNHVTGLLENILSGIQLLPDLMGAIIPRLAGEFVPALIVGLLQALPEIGMELFKIQFTVGKALITDLPDTIAIALVDWLRDLKAMLQELWQDITTRDKNDNSEDSFWTKLRNATVDTVRGASAVATAGASEVVYRAVDYATEGKLTDAAYNGDREKRTANTNRKVGSALSRPNQMTSPDREVLGVQTTFNRFDNRGSIRTDGDLNASPFVKRRG